MDLAGPVTGDGQFLIGQAATLELGGPTAEAVTFESGGAVARCIWTRPPTSPARSPDWRKQIR